MAQDIKILGSTTSTPSTLGYRKPAVSFTGGKSKFYVGDSFDNPQQINSPQNVVGVTPSTGNAHKVLTVKEDGSDFEVKIAVPTYTTAQRNALTNVPDTLIIYNSTASSFQQYQTSSWVNIGGGGGGGSATWGDITGTLSNQTDLQNALNAKQDLLGFTPEDVANKNTTSLNNSVSEYPANKVVKDYVDAGLLSKENTITPGTTSQYWRGDKSWQTLNSNAVGLGNVPNIDATNASNISSGTLPNARLANQPNTASSPNTLALRDSNSNITSNNLITSGQSIATAGGVTNLTVSSPFITIFTGTTTQTCRLPDTSTLPFYTPLRIINKSTAVVTVQTSAGNTIQAMEANTEIYLSNNSISSNATAAWDWSYSRVSAPLAGGTTLPVGTIALMTTRDSSVNSAEWIEASGQVVPQASYLDLFTEIGILDPLGSMPNFDTTTASATLPNTLNDIAAGGGVFIMVGNNGIIRRTADNGAIYTSPASGTTSNIYQVAFANGIFIAVCDGGRVLRSADLGQTWNTVFLLSGAFANFNLRCVSFINNTWVICGANNYIGYTTNPTAADGWTNTDSYLITPNTTLVSLAYFNGRYMATAGTPQSRPDRVFIASTNLTSWAWLTTNIPYSSGFVMDTLNNVLVAGGCSNYSSGSATSVVTRTNNGTDWRTRHLLMGTNNNPRSSALAVNGPLTLAINGHLFSRMLMYSDDGYDFRGSYLGAFEPNGVATDGRNVVVVGTAGNIRTTTTDNLASISTPAGGSGTTTNLLGVTYGQGNYVTYGNVEGGFGVVRRSPDAGQNWFGIATGTNQNVTALTFWQERNMWLFGTATGQLFRNTADIASANFALAASSAGAQVTALGTVYNTGTNGIIAYGTSGGAIGISSDGSNFTAATSNTTKAIGSFATGNGITVYRAQDTVGFTLNGGSTWTNISLPSILGRLNNTNYDNNMVVFDNSSGTFSLYYAGVNIRSFDGQNWFINQTQDCLLPNSSGWLNFIKATNGGFVLGYSGMNANLLGYTKDGSSFRYTRTNSVDVRQRGAAYQNGLLMILGNQNSLTPAGSIISMQRETYNQSTHFRLPKANRFGNPDLIDAEAFVPAKYYIKYK